MNKSILFIALYVCFFYTAKSQYTLNGNATQNDCHCYTLTENLNNQSGSVWNNNKINLNQSFDFTFQVYLGCNDNNGADGIAFVLQPISVSVGTSGGGMGFQNINPSVGVTMDTYQNTLPDADPSYDHIAIQINGVINHLSASTLTPATPISATSNNVEDCQNHSLRIVWNASTTTLTTYFDGVLRVSATNNFVNNVFSGNPLVYWGFTGATGGLYNLQQFCTTLTPTFHFLPNQRKCVNEPISFIDSTISFTGLLKRYWNFGDGSPIDSVNVNPVHSYTTAGDFTVTLRVVGIDGCEEIFTQIVHVGSKPVAGFSYNATCQNSPVQFSDTSHVAVGTINTWFWDLDNNGITSTAQNLFTTYTTPGIKHIKFVVKTLEGCQSDTLFQTINITPRATVDFSFTDSVCFGTPTYFYDNSTIGGSSSAINYWQWTYSDSSFPALIRNPTHIFTTPGNHTVTLTTSGAGSSSCLGTAITKIVFVADKPVAKMKALNICERQQLQLLDSSYSSDGLSITNCWWDLGNGQFSNLCNPLVTYSNTGPVTIKHVVYNSRGCKSDTLIIILNVTDKPLVNFSISRPICNDSSITLSDISTIQVGTINQWNWVYNNSTFSTQQNTTSYFPYGNISVGLSVMNNLGCFSDTLYQTFKLIKNPIVNAHFNDTCKYDPIIFSGSETITNTGIAAWTWNFGDGQQATGSPITHTYTNNGHYMVTLYATSNDGCKDTLIDYVDIYGTNAFAGYDTTVAANQPIQLHATGGVSYEWSPSAGLNATNIANPIATVTANTTYYLKAYTPTGCQSFDTINIFVYKGPHLYMPTAFTPNGDNLNDILTAFPIGISNFEYLSIYNRFGQLMFRTTNVKKGWDGRYKGVLQPMGTYVWIAKVTYFDRPTTPIVEKGTVLLLK